MRLPSPNSSNAVRNAYGRYVQRRLRTAKEQALEAEVKAKNDELRAADRADEDAEYARQEALADRDASDDALDDVAKRHRQTIEGRGTLANRERPYTDIYDQGIEHYTSAPLDEQEARYKLLVRRYDAFLAEGDPVRAEGHLITEGIVRWVEARTGLEKAELELVLAKAKTERAVEQWEETLRRVYHRLAERLGKAVAERFFPRGRRGKRDDDGGGEEPTK